MTLMVMLLGLTSAQSGTEFIQVRAETVVTRNADWTPVYKTDDSGTRMVQVPAGSFQMGSVSGGYSDEQPVTTVTFAEPYWIDETEVTRAAYQSCVDVGACTANHPSEWSDQPNQPINQVTWYQAAGYCSWRGARLPTEAEWEYAARGPDSLIYPWGNTNDASRANGLDASLSRTTTVGSYPQGASWVGALDMAGNVWEWTRTRAQSYPYSETDGRNLRGDEGDVSDSIVLRGGSFYNSSVVLRSAFRNGFSADIDRLGFGFRCARSNSGF